MPDKNKKIIILDPQADLNSLFFFFKELSLQNQIPVLFSVDRRLEKKFRENKLNAHTLGFWPKLKTPGHLVFILLFLPFLFLYLLFRLILIKKKTQGKHLIVFSVFDAIFSARAGRLLGLKPLWLILPETKNYFGSSFKKLWLRLACRSVCLSEKSKLLLMASGLKNSDKLTIGVKLGLGHQDSIFSELAKSKDRLPSQKFFSVGTVLDLGNKHNLETIFQGLKQAQTVIKNLQFIIVGDGTERRNLQWLTKRIGIESIVWFVGEQKCLKKWLTSLDAYIFAASPSGLSDFNYALLAMAASLPIISPQEAGLEEFATNFKQGLLLEKNSAEDLSRALIRLKTDPRLRQDLGAAGKKSVEENFRVEKMAEEFIKLIK